MKFGKNWPKISAFFFTFASVSVLLFGCVVYDHDDDDGEIRICNYDNHEYRVVLYDYHNDRIEDEFWLGERYDFGDNCDEFDHLDSGRYYIAIYRENDSRAWDVSGHFYFEDDEYEYFWIDEDGDIHWD